MKIRFHKVQKHSDKLLLPKIKIFADWCISRLISNPRKIKKLEVNFKFKSIDDYNAVCEPITYSKTPNKFLITIDKHLLEDELYYELFTTISHELVHVKQYAVGDLTIKNSQWVYKGKNYKKINQILDYFEQPWEIEAYGREKGFIFTFKNFIEPHFKNLT